MNAFAFRQTVNQHHDSVCAGGAGVGGLGGAAGAS